ncbi:MAG TPA: TniQ family protein [Trichocoleus sp.]|jgi:transcriptional regulator with XRE-family HTH domain
MKLLHQNHQLHQDLVLPSYPSRSRLFCIKPIGIGTQLTESLIGFTTRLSEAHCLPSGVLMEREVAPTIAKIHGGGNLHKIYDHTAALNGTGVMALSLASALEKLSGQINLHLLTLAPWSELMPSRRLLRRNRAWCSFCYETWRITEHIIYEPLLWSLDAVKVCPLHHCLLCETCSHCHQKNLPLAWHSRPGYCSKCHDWLGLQPGNSVNNLKNCTEDELRELAWITNSVGDLLASTPSLPLSFTKEILAQAFRVHVNLASNGNVAEFARQLQLPRNTVWLWCNGKNLPQLDTLVQVCYRLDRSLIEFITQEPKQSIHVNVTNATTPLKSKPKAKARVFNMENLEQQLEAILLNHQCPPPPLAEVARQLEINEKTLFRLFAEMCRAISAKYDKFQKALYYQRIEQSREEVRQAVIKLYNEGLYPSEERVSQLVSRPGYLRYKQVRAAIEETKLEFSIQRIDSSTI